MAILLAPNGTVKMDDFIEGGTELAQRPGDAENDEEGLSPQQFQICVQLRNLWINTEEVKFPQS
jgi:hypothetical protein